MRAYLCVSVAAFCLFAKPVLGQPQGLITPASSKTQSIFEALRHGTTLAVRTAIAEGVDVNSRNADGNTLLMQAAVYGTSADLDFLLAHGADVNAANKAGHTALMRAMPDLAKIKLLAEHGADVNASARGTTPLLIAAGTRSAEDVVKYLIQRGADLKAVDGSGANAVMTAAAVGAANVSGLLLLPDPVLPKETQ
jgi:uncharacterized protein